MGTASAPLLAWALGFALAAPGAGRGADPDPASGESDPNDRGSCDESPSSPWTWDAARNRCVFKRSASRTRERFRRCARIEDADRRKACLEGNRDALVGEDATRVDDPVGGGLSVIAASVPLAFHVARGVARRGGKLRGSCASAKMFMGASLASVGAEAFFRWRAKATFDGLAEERGELDETDPYEMQVASFSFLERQHDETAKIAGRMQKAHWALTTAYAGTAALAVAESSAGPVAGLPPCAGGASGGDGGDDVSGGEGGGTSVANDPVPRMTRFLGRSPGIAAVSGAMAVLNGVLARAAGRAREQALARARTVKEARESFEAMRAQVAPCPSRNDERAPPECYCHTEDGRRNSKRSDSATCRRYWAELDGSLHAAPDDRPHRPGQTPARKGCVDVRRGFDLECKCLGTLGADGRDTCYKTNLGAAALSAFAPGAMVSEAAAGIDAIARGGPVGGLAGRGDLGKQAARALAGLAGTIAKQDAMNKERGDPPVAKILAGIDAAAARFVPPSGAAGSVLGSLARAPAPKKTAAGAGKAPKKGSGAGAASPAAASARGGRGGGKRARPLFNESAARGPKSLDFMDKNYDYSKALDGVAGNAAVSLWAVISNRYALTGLARLFGDDGAPPPP